jgi:hypothetical protein
VGTLPDHIRCDFRDPDTRRRCYRPARGSLGMLKLCRGCAARLMGWDPTDPRLRESVAVRLMYGRAFLGWVEWTPFPRA